jgi:hypothetical protein
MNSFSGPLDGHAFTAELPFIVIGWPSKSAVTTFETKVALWNYLEAASRRDPDAILARAYEFTGKRWERMPALPTYLSRRQDQYAHSLPSAAREEWGTRPTLLAACNQHQVARA